MDRTQATEILKHILEAFDAIDRAGEIVVEVDGEDRVALSGPIGEIVAALHFGLPPAVYPGLAASGRRTAGHQHVS